MTRLSILLAIATWCASAADAPRTFYMGFTPWPYASTEQAVNDTYDFIAKHADMINHHRESVPWAEALSGEPFRKGFEDELQERKKRVPKGHKLLLSVSALDMGRKGMALYFGDKENMPLPPEFKDKRFTDPAVEKAYFNYCRRAIELFQPDYFLMGIETNELLNNTPAQWADYVSFSRKVRRQLKQRFPKLPIAESITLHKLLEKGNKDLEAYRKQIKEFISDHDFFAVSFYPFFAGLHKREEFASALSWLASYAGKKPIGFSETANAAEDIDAATWKLHLPSTLAEQNDYVSALLEAATRDKYLFLNQFCWKDFDEMWKSFPAEVKDLGRIWRDTGLVDEQNKERPAFATWMKYFNRPLVARGK